MVDTKMNAYNAAVSAYNNASKIGAGAAPLEDSSDAGKPSFGDLLGESLSTAKNTGYKTESISAKSLVEKSEMHELVTSVTNADLTLNTVVAVRDRIINAYQDILKMPI